MASDDTVEMSNGHATCSNGNSSNSNNNNNIPGKAEYRREWAIKASPKALGTVNPIRSIVEGLNLTPNPEKPFIPLSIGDPTLFGDFKPCREITDAVTAAIQSEKCNGYQPSAGREDARTAIAEYCAAYGMNVDAKDIIITSGCSHALDLALTVLASPGSNVLVPRPGFPLYKTLSTLLGIEIRYYNLLPERSWQIDLEDLEAKIDDRTSAIIYNNPSNPCGSVFPRSHIVDFVAVAERHRLPIIGDEIYEDLVFSGSQFHAVASLSEEVPVLHCSGTTKKFLVPGWRIGWIAINDRKGRFGKDVRSALNSLSQRIIGANTVIQGALPDILKKTPRSFFEDTIAYIERNAVQAYSKLKRIPGLTPIQPSGAFYIMVRIEVSRFPHFRSDLHFVESLVAEESVFCLPGNCFEYPGYVRLVLAISNDMLEEALARIDAFCTRYYV